MDSTILVTGGTGAMGSVLVRRLCEKGRRVRVLTVRDDPYLSRLDGTGADVRFGDITDPSSLAGLCDGIAAVFHLAAIIITPDESQYQRINVQGTRNVVDAALRAGVRHFIHVSSASVIYPQPTPYSLSKRAGERIVRESGLGWSIIRPTLVYGKQGGQEFDMFLDYLRKFPVVPFIGDGSALKRPVYVEDIIEGLLKIAGLEKGSEKVYNFCGDSRITMKEFARLCLVLMGQAHKPIVSLPVWFCTIAASAMKLTMKNPPLKWSVIAGVIQDADLDPSDAIREIGYSPSELMEHLPHCFPRSKI